MGREGVEAIAPNRPSGREAGWLPTLRGAFVGPLSDGADSAFGTFGGGPYEPGIEVDMAILRHDGRTADSGQQTWRRFAKRDRIAISIDDMRSVNATIQP